MRSPCSSNSTPPPPSASSKAASLPETLVERAAALGYPALALVDRDGVYGAPRFHKAAQGAGIKAIIGCEITIGGRGSEPGCGRQQKQAADAGDWLRRPEPLLAAPSRAPSRRADSRPTPSP